MGGKPDFGKIKLQTKTSLTTLTESTKDISEGSAREIQEPVASLDHIPSTPQLMAKFIFSTWSCMCGSAFGERGRLCCF